MFPKELGGYSTLRHLRVLLSSTELNGILNENKVCKCCDERNYDVTITLRYDETVAFKFEAQKMGSYEKGCRTLFIERKERWTKFAERVSAPNFSIFSTR